MDDNLRRLRRGADEIQRKHNVIAKNLRRHYYLSIIGNVLGVLATITANGSSDLLSSLFYIGKWIVWIVNHKTFKQENTSCEKEIKKVFDRVIQKDGPQDSKQGVFASSFSRKLHYSVPFILVWDICKIIHFKKTLSVTENIQRLNTLVTDAGNTVAMQKNRIENLAPLFENIKSIIKTIDNKTGHVVKLIPGIKVPDNRNINDALYKKLIKLHSKPPFIGPISDKKYLHLKKEIEEAKTHKNKFDENAYGVLKSARKCLQSSFEAKKLPTFTFAESQDKNLELLNDTKISLDAIKEIGGEFQHLQLDKQENQKALVTGLATMLDNATETLANVSEFNIDIKSKLERASVKRAAKKVVGYAKKGGRINHQVDETVTSMKIANKAMEVVEKKTSRFWGRIKPEKMNEIKQQKEAETYGTMKVCI
ncbi:uncharacterized protein LOC132714533 [Ruditapes philippinarum]|uniref:uncharacterized protein LOC132714533 n=1 Tax=Ruditapes philippinarum TaxID=129788 RepID=UPI00295AC465|nr:uncharacterized protein LOC132714533 [Ruditapes philippinarum]